MVCAASALACAEPALNADGGVCGVGSIDQELGARLSGRWPAKGSSYWTSTTEIWVCIADEHPGTPELRQEIAEVLDDFEANSGIRYLHRGLCSEGAPPPTWVEIHAIDEACGVDATNTGIGG